MRLPSALRLIPVAPLLALFAGCGAPRAVAPRPLTYAAAIGATCSSSGPAEPFIVDWPADKRGDVELALKRKLVAVAFTCDRIQILPDCEIAGSYAYVGVTEREEVISIVDAEEARVNLPFGGAAFAARVGADFERGATLDVALAMVGKKTSSKRRVLRSELKGECAGATHFVRSATLGAFAMQTGTKGRARAAAELFGFGAEGVTSTTTSASHRDGSLEACRQVDPASEAEEPRCASPLRLELKPIADSGGTSAASVDEREAPVACPAGTLPSDSGKCIGASSTLPHICRPENAADCATQCERGSLGSCAILGRSYQIGRGVPRDPKRGVDLLVRACKGGIAPACGRVGETLLDGPRDEEGMKLLNESCRAGFSEGCAIAGRHLMKKIPTGKVDLGQLAAQFRRACAQGDGEGCWTMGEMFAEGFGYPKNDAEAARWFERACDAGARLGCSSYGNSLDKGLGVAADPAKAVRVLSGACEDGFGASCAVLGKFYFLGRVVTKDEAKGIELLERACRGNDPSTCFVLGVRYERGVSVPRDPRRALEYLNRACETGSTIACEEAQRLGAE